MSRPSDPVSSFVSARTKPDDPVSRYLVDKRKPSPACLRGRRVGSFRRVRFMRGLDVAARRFGWDVKVKSVAATPMGTEADLVFKRRNAEVELTKTADELKGIFAVRDVSVVVDVKDASRATLHLAERDLLAERAGAPWPGLEADELSLWDPIDLGWNGFGQTMRPHLMGRHCGMFGETGSGKSVAQAMIVATAALSDARIFLMDANEIQLARWRPVAEEFVVDDMPRAIECLAYLLGEVARRNALVSEAGLDKLERGLAEGLGEPPLLLVIDEGADFLRAKDFLSLLTRLAARGRAAGLCIVFATQSPNATIIPTTLRNNLGLRAVFRVADKAASQVALGTSAVDASRIAPEDRGVCFLHQDGVLPTRMRTFYLTPEQVRERCARAMALRGRSTT